MSFAFVAALLGWLSSILGWGPSFNDFVSVTSNLMKFVSLRFVLLSVWLWLWVLVLVLFLVLGSVSVSVLGFCTLCQLFCIQNLRKTAF